MEVSDMSQDYDRTKRVSHLVEDTEQLCDELYDKFKDFTDGYRIILLLERKKDGGGSHKPQKHAIRWITKDSAHWKKYLSKALFLQKVLNIQGDAYRIYASVNPRNIQKGILHFKHEQVDSEHGDQDQCEYWYADIQDRFIGAMMKPGSKDGSLFLIDVDGDQTLVGQVLQQVAELGLDILLQYGTKNGWHIIVSPFNPTLFKPIEGVEVKTDSLLAISY